MSLFRFEQRLTRECTVCQQEIEFERQRTTEIIVQIFGASAYAQCCCCGQEALDRLDRNYRRRFRRWLARLKWKHENDAAVRERATKCYRRPRHREDAICGSCGYQGPSGRELDAEVT